MLRPPSPTPVRGLLRCLDHGFLIQSFEEEGYRTIGELRAAGQEEVDGFIKSLGMKWLADDRLLAFAFGAKGSEESASSAEGLPITSVSRAMDAGWREAVMPLFALSMGCENMGPLLYSLVRFVKPKICLEIGAGYTTAFLLQALDENHMEEQLWSDWTPSATEVAGSMTREKWLAPQVDGAEKADAVLHCVDNLAHNHTTAHKCLAVAQQLNLEHLLRLHLDDGRAFLEESADTVPTFDFIWLDGLLDFARSSCGRDRNVSRVLTKGQRLTDIIAAEDSWGQGIDKLLDLIWPRVAPGGFLLLHSTLTNSTVRRWIEGVDGRGPPSGAVISLHEPHKRFQNSCTLIQKRPEGWAGEPIYSELP